ncbi:energy transducer TonB [Paraburkholderia hayleyella]|uniref:energy transducer TonB n=1 Tax=Paraburkholderia hayleyella TaxID=2152889 RepID=UPI0012910534|nr:energy transducer TonB [Paraburkholderia hayleyella]
MQASSPASTGSLSADLTRMNPRIIAAIAVVVVIHIVLLTVLLRAHNDTPPRAIESRTITAELLSPTPTAAPAALQSTPLPPTPAPPTPPRAKPKVQPRPAPAAKPAPSVPLPEATAPSAHAIASTEPSTEPAPAAAAPAAAATPAPGPTMALSAPKNVAHLDCNIIQPAYPALSQRRGESGTAHVRFVVGLSGKIESIELKKSSGYSRLDDAAVAAMRASSCRPYIENGTPIRAMYTQPFEFGLND